MTNTKSTGSRTTNRSTILAEDYILLSGTHSRIEGGKKIKYRAGDLLKLTADELNSSTDRFMPLSEFEEKLDAFEQERADEKERFEKAKSHRAMKGKNRDPEAVKRGDQLLEMRKTEKRVSI